MISHRHCFAHDRLKTQTPLLRGAFHHLRVASARMKCLRGATSAASARVSGGASTAHEQAIQTEQYDGAQDRKAHARHVESVNASAAPNARANEAANKGAGDTQQHG